MLRSTASELMWVGRTAAALFGLALVLALVLGVATTALAAIPGDPFKLGRINTIDAVSTLAGNVAGPMLRVDNNSTEMGATALDLRVEAGKAPMKVNSAKKVAKLNADSLDGKDASEFAKAYKSTVVVSPVGSDIENGTALINAINGITDASATKPYLLYIEAGTYDLGSGSLAMKEHVDIEGAGEIQTLITGSGVSANGCQSGGTVEGADNAELRFLTVRNTAEVDCGVAVHTNLASPHLTHITAESIGGGLFNVGVASHSEPTMTNITTKASGSARNNVGVITGPGNSSLIKQSTLSGEDASVLLAAGSTKIALSQLDGPVAEPPTGGTARCFNNYDENLDPVTCP